MKKIMCFMFCAALASVAWSQELHVASGGVIHVAPKSYVHVNGNMGVDGAGNLTVESNAANSGALMVTGTATGDISYVRYVPTDKWHFVSAPVTTQDIGAFAVDAANDIKNNIANTVYGISVYNNANTPTERWMYYGTPGNPTPLPGQQNAGLASSAGNFVNGKGYSNLRTSAGNYTFKGNMANADVGITIPVGDGTAENHHWGLVGNPYPSFLAGNTPANATNLLTHNAGILKTGKVAIYVWDGTDYQAINHSDPALFIAPGQGFIVEAKANGETFTFPKALQKPQTAATAAFYKGEAMTSVTLFLSDGNTEKKTRLRYLDANATTGLDEGYDAGSYRDGVPTFSIDTHLVSDSTGLDFTIQCLPKADLEDIVVPVAVYAKANDVLNFRTEIENLATGVNVYLEDKVNNTITKLNDASYNVTVNADQNGIGRFYLYTIQGVLNIEDVFSLNNVSIYKTDNNTLRIAGLKTEGSATLKIYSILGKEVADNSFNVQNINDVQLPRLSTGVYIVKVVSNSGNHSKKIIIE